MFYFFYYQIFRSLSGGFSKTSFASLIFAARNVDPPLSGWFIIINFLCAALISSSVAVPRLYTTKYRVYNRRCHSYKLSIRAASDRAIFVPNPPGNLGLDAYICITFLTPHAVPASPTPISSGNIKYCVTLLGKIFCVEKVTVLAGQTHFADEE